MRKMCAKEYKGQLEGAATDKIWGDLSLKKCKWVTWNQKEGPQETLLYQSILTNKCKKNDIFFKHLHVATTPAIFDSDENH